MHASGRVNKPAGLGPHKPPINWRIEGKILTGREIERKLSTGIRCAQSGSFAFYTRYTRYTAVIGVIIFFFSIFACNRGMGRHNCICQQTDHKCEQRAERGHAVPWHKTLIYPTVMPFSS